VSFRRGEGNPDGKGSELTEPRLFVPLSRSEKTTNPGTTATPHPSVVLAKGFVDPPLIGTDEIFAAVLQ
jgi:hypothetical protein